MQRLPIFLSFKNKTAVIVGGGRMAARHISKLLGAGMKEITIYSPAIDDTVYSLLENEKVKWVKERIQKPRSFAADLVLLVTPDRKLNQQLYEYKAPYQLIYVATDHELSDIHFPTTISRGHLTVAVSTNGSSPIYAKRVKNKIEQVLHDQIEDDLDFLFMIRTRLKELHLSSLKRKEILQIVASEKVLRKPDRVRYAEVLIEEFVDKG